MAKLLYITCNLNPIKLSRSLSVGSEFLNEYRRCNRRDEIHFLDLYRDSVQRIDADVLTGYEKMLSGQPPAALDSDEQRKIVRIWRFVDQFIAFDKYVLITSTWHPGSQAGLKLYAGLYAELKMYIDTGKTFNSIPAGIEGLLKNKKKKCLLIRSTGGLNYGKEEDNCLLQFSSVMGFMGVENVMHIDVCGPDAITETEAVTAEDINKARAAAAFF
ncbi:MAG: NAD(P)H-dependent oxidoreductase [Dissulfurispiraceae bacterium]|jgi:FMN-dependent NADH-azoreductase